MTDPYWHDEYMKLRAEEMKLRADFAQDIAAMRKRYEASLNATAELLFVLDPCIQMIEAGIVGDFDKWPTWHRLKEARANAAARLADFVGLAP